MANNNNLIPIPGRMHCVATEGVATGADEIFDDAKGKRQSVINQETDASLDNKYDKDETYSKQELNNLITTPNQDYVTVPTYGSLPATGEADTVYRVSNYDGEHSQVDATKYSEYAWDGTQYVFLCVKSQIGEVFDITVYNNNTKYADLTAALGTGGANIPEGLRKGGMSVKYVRTYDNKYVQYRLMSDTFNTTVANWQGVDEEPTSGSENLVKSGGVSTLSRLSKFNSVCIDTYKSPKYSFNARTTHLFDIKLSQGEGYTFINHGTVSVAVSLIFIDDTRYTLNGGGGIIPENKITFTPEKEVKTIRIYAVASDSAFYYEIVGEKNIAKTIDYINNTNNVFQIFNDNTLNYIDDFAGGDVGGDVNITANQVWRHVILPINGSNIIYVDKCFKSSLGQSILYLDANDKILRKDHQYGDSGSSWYGSIPDNATKVVVNLLKINRADPTAVYKHVIKLYRWNLFNQPFTTIKNVYCSNGDIVRNPNSDLNKFVCEGANILVAKITSYVGGVTSYPNIFNFFTKEGTFISSFVKAGSSIQYERVVAAEVPENAYYCLITSRRNTTLTVYSTSHNDIEKIDGVYEVNIIETQHKANYILDGEVGGNTSEVSATNRNYAIIPWVDGYDVFCYEETYNYNAAVQNKVIQIDASGNILAVDKVINWIGPTYHGVKKVSGAVYVCYDFNNNHYTAFFAKLHEVFLTTDPVKRKVTDTGELINVPTISSYKVNVEHSPYVIADIRQFYGRGDNNECVTFAFFDCYDNFISYSIKQISVKVDGIAWAKTPNNASYVCVQTRDYQGNPWSPGDATQYIPHFYVVNEQSVIDNQNDVEMFKPQSLKNNQYMGERINLKGYSITVIGQNIIKCSVNNQTTVADTNLAGQGCVVYGDYLFRFHNKGYCVIYDISNIADIKYVTEYELGSYNDNNHANSASFAKDVYGDTGFPLLYTAGLYGNKAYVDSVSLEGSTHIQTITFDLASLATEHYYPQAVVGNDGYLWVLAFPALGSGGAPHDKWYFYKFAIPDTSVSEVTLTDSDALDYWVADGANMYVHQDQGMIVENGRLYLLSGADAHHDYDEPSMPRCRVLNVWNTTTHQLVSTVNLSNTISQELEDCAIYKGQMIVVVNGNNKAYLLDFD